MKTLRISQKTLTLSSFEGLKNLLKEGKTIIGLSEEVVPAVPFFVSLENDIVMATWNDKTEFIKSELFEEFGTKCSYIIVERSDFMTK